MRDIKELSMDRDKFIRLVRDRCPTVGIEVSFDKIILNGHVDLGDCKTLISLPDGLVVSDTLNLEGCSSLERLCDGLVVKGYFDLESCTSLRILPERLVVKGFIYLEKCRLYPLPSDLLTGGIIGDWEEISNTEQFMREGKDAT